MASCGHKERLEQLSESQSEGGSRFNVLLAGLLPLLGAIAYAIFRGSYVRLYSRFGVTPEDVGVDSSAVLTGAARILYLGNWRPGIPHVPSKPLLIAGILVVIVVIACAIRSWASQYDRAPRRLGKLRRWLRTTSLINFVLLYLGILFLVAILVFLAWVPRDSDLAFKRIYSGTQVRPGDFAFLVVQAYPAHLIWSDMHPPPEMTTLTDGASLLYLGHAAGEIVLYDPHTNQTWRIPESSAVVSLKPTR